jgi:predicted choloylglycine hydrolase
MSNLLQKRFRFVDEAIPGAQWQQFYLESADSYRKWFLKEGEFNRPGYMECRKALLLHMPELVPLWESMIDLCGGGDLVARLLSLYCPTPYLSGCSQAAWLRYNPILVRNYDYDQNGVIT